MTPNILTNPFGHCHRALLRFVQSRGTPKDEGIPTQNCEDVAHIGEATPRSVADGKPVWLPIDFARNQSGT